MKNERPKLTEFYIKQNKMADPRQSYQLDSAVKFVAECMDMCPEYEREEREYTNYLEPFEKIPGTERVDHVKAVKRYKRSAAGDPPPLPCDVRPPEVLFVRND
jgi:nuclear mRNA export protein SAC3